MTTMDFDLGPLYKAGFKDGADSVIEKVSKWLDPDTIAELKESYKEDDRWDTHTEKHT